MNRFHLCTAMFVLWAVSATPVAAAIIANVVETGGDNEPTDTITAKWTGQTWPISVANEPVPGAVIGNNYTTGFFQHQAPAYVDRNHRYSDDATLVKPIPAYLVGGEYIMIGNDNRDNNPQFKLDVTINSAATVYMLIDNRLQDGDNATPPTFGPNMQWILDQGWMATSNGLNRTSNAAVPDEVAFDEGANNTIDQWLSVYKKKFPAGTFSLLQPDNAGRDMYGVVITVPEPAMAILLLLAVPVGAACLRRKR